MNQPMTPERRAHIAIEASIASVGIRVVLEHLVTESAGAIRRAAQADDDGAIEGWSKIQRLLCHALRVADEMGD